MSALAQYLQGMVKMLPEATAILKKMNSMKQEINWKQKGSNVSYKMVQALTIKQIDRCFLRNRRHCL
jgi:hypothetical protein